MFEQHITRLAPFIYRGLKGVGLEGEEYAFYHLSGCLEQFVPRLGTSCSRAWNTP